LRESSDPDGALAELSQLREAYLDMPHSAVDAVVRETLSKAAECAERCVYHAHSRSGKEEGSEIAAFLKEAADSGPQEEVPLPGGMTAGVIRDIFHEKGFGFVRTTDGREFFFHRTDMNLVDSWFTVQIGEEVVFQTGTGPKGPFAKSVWRKEDFLARSSKSIGL
jgi:cold shock CspA family protein